MLTFLTVSAILVALVGVFVFGALFGRKNTKKVELAVEAAKDPRSVAKKLL